MPIAFLAALAGSLAIHAAALFMPDVDLSTVPELPPITAEIQLPPRLPAEIQKRAEAPAVKHSTERRHAKPARAPVAVASPPAPVVATDPGPPAALLQPKLEPIPEPEPIFAPEPDPRPEMITTADPRLPGRGYIRFNVYKGRGGLLVGEAQHSWEFADDGQYRMLAITETVGLAALLKPIRIELESRGSLTADGLQPERFTTRRNGSETNENADFDWAAHEVTLGRDGRRRPMADGTQDLLSFHYQFGYLARLDSGVGMGVATGKKFENYRFDTVGEENIDTPAGTFRTLHVRVQTDSTTELWLALDRLLLPVKIRHTDKKGDSFEQVATELGM